MTKIIEVWQGAMVLLLVAAVSDTRTPLAPEAPCIQEDLEVLMSNLTSWICNLTCSHYEPAAVAEIILNYCDTNNDSALDQTELATCVHCKLAASISDTCFTHVFKNLDENSDGVVDLAELMALITAVGGHRCDHQRRTTVQAKRVDDSRIRSGLTGEIWKKDRSNSGSLSRTDVLREERDDSSDSGDSESSGDDSDSNSRDDEFKIERDDSSDSDDSESSGDDGDSNSREDVLRKERDDSSDSDDSESSGDDSDDSESSRDDSGDSESSGDDSDSNSREDELRKERDDSSDSDDSESSGDDAVIESSGDDAVIESSGDIRDSNSRVAVLK